MPEKGDLRDFPAKDGKGASCSLIVEGTSILLSRDHERGSLVAAPPITCYRDLYAVGPSLELSR